MYHSTTPHLASRQPNPTLSCSHPSSSRLLSIPRFSKGTGPASPLLPILVSDVQNRDIIGGVNGGFPAYYYSTPPRLRLKAQQISGRLSFPWNCCTNAKGFECNKVFGMKVSIHEYK
ncbi:unnamed protein product [Chondrus crispus]|uniref:Uncharacterized protein n=1 Tax=Chondrus crispus TaxID=2769 RepID=R7QMN3_CHOCR|nr:unnamed protein product [Chondrus crispus]CDF38746.1 unnamed protein product [Chondrus crispus]|eukprot:XP_005718651.1 unnamed protein product [Chondrus crispus]